MGFVWLVSLPSVVVGVVYALACEALCEAVRLPVSMCAFALYVCTSSVV